MQKMMFVTLLCATLCATANDMSVHRELDGFEVHTKRSQALPMTAQKMAKVERPETVTAETVSLEAPAKTTLSPRSHPTHRAGLHK